jgi:adenosylcobinamide-GDP ribazoletransferase
MSELRLFLTAVQYFTRIPVPAWVGHSADQLNAAARWFPAVGIGVGGAAALSYALVAVTGALPLALVLSTATSVWLTGAFHEDGLADTADGLGGGYTRERALEIMKDSRIGTYGMVALALTLATKIAALHALPTLAPAALVAGHALSRLMAVTIIARQSYVREDDSSRAKPLSHAISPTGLAVATLTGLAPLALLGLGALPMLGAAVLARLWLGGLFARRLGGYTGDCLGATQQICEAAGYVGLVLGTTLLSWS